ncbi:MAG: hypothetical protein RIT45_2512 [Pseudomonadota bacterium]|jgi:hypothetical protein
MVLAAGCGTTSVSSGGGGATTDTAGGSDATGDVGGGSDAAAVDAAADTGKTEDTATGEDTGKAEDTAAEDTAADAGTTEDSTDTVADTTTTDTVADTTTPDAVAEDTGGSDATDDTADTTPAPVCGADEMMVGQFSEWCGKVSVHTDKDGKWVVDSDCSSGCNQNPLNYCKKFYPEATSGVPMTVTPEDKPFTNAGCSQTYMGPGLKQRACCVDITPP